MIVSIHQPDFFPWLGVFDKINKSDLFVYLDHVVNNPRDPLWTKRVQIIINSQPYWLTIPLERPKESIFLPIKEMKICENRTVKKMIKTVELAYKKAPYFNEIFPLIESFYKDNEPLIAKRNINFIDSVCDKLEINTNRHVSSDFSYNQKSTELLIEIIKYFDGDKYIYGKGALDYQNDERFEEENIQLIYQNFMYPIYNQFNTKKFIPGLSIIDPLMNLGFDGVKKLLKFDI